MPNLHIGQYGADLINFMTGHFKPFFDLVSTVLLHSLRGVYLLVTALQPDAMVAVFTLIAVLAMRRIVLPVLLGAALLLVISMDLWTQAMESMATVIVAAAVALAVGIPLGIWSAFSPVVRALVQPVLDLMQTLPVFVYLLPTILFFGIGVVPGVVATMVFCLPPAVRLTQLGIRQVDPDTVEAARAFGASKAATLRDVQLPLAMPSIMAGVNQVIMLALSMVVVAGLVGGGGLGDVVVNAVQSLDIGSSIQGGLAVVFLAIYLDRVTSALGSERRAVPSWWPALGRSARIPAHTGGLGADSASAGNTEREPKRAPVFSD
jgi:glycine betaine/proline transport system permease protein